MEDRWVSTWTAIGGMWNPPKPSENGDKDLLTVREAAEYLQVHEKTVYKWIKAKRIPFSRMGRSIRFSRAKLEQYVEVRVGGSSR